MTKINAKIVADSVDPRGHRLVSYIITFPRYILAELNTHRMLSKNSASSRAIPFDKLLKSVEENPFIPVAWMKEHKGMQGSSYFDKSEILTESIMGQDFKETAPNMLDALWLSAKDSALEEAVRISNQGATKQMVNRVLEPYMWHTVLISGPTCKLEKPPPESPH